MFVLTKVDNSKEKIVLMRNKPMYSIGRIGTDVLLSEDLSISRAHVHLHLPTSETSQVLTVEDQGSKYGTFLRDEIKANKKMQAKTPTPLNVGDKLRIGALKNIWQLSQLKLQTTTSALTQPEAQQLNQHMKALNGEVLPTWTDECTHLTMNKVTVTVKLLHALLENKPIVKVEFWRELFAAARSIHITKDWPNPKDFEPAHSADVPDISWRPERTKVFARKTVVFMNRKHYDAYGPVVEKAGGSCKDLNSGVRKAFLTKKDVMVIQYVASTESQATEAISNVQDILEQAGLRLIPDYEIGLAILHCSTEKFCNPAHKIFPQSYPATESMNSSILVASTERTQASCTSTKASELVIPESAIYAPSVGSDKMDEEPESEPQAVAQTSKPLVIGRVRKSKNSIYLDSSDNDEPLAKKVAEPKSKRKRKINIIDDSSDEEKQQMKRNKPAPESKVKSKKIQSISLDSSSETAEEQPKAATSRRVTRKSNNVQDQTAVSTSSPRRSPRGKPIAQRVVLTVPEQDSEDEELFQFKKKIPSSVERVPLLPAEPNIQADKSLRSKSTDQPVKINVNKFMEKPQSQSISQAAAAPSVPSQPKKRLRLEQLNESDSDDNDNLFNFNNNNNKKPRQSLEQNKSDNESDTELFSFSKSQAQKRVENRSVEIDCNQDSVSTERLTSADAKKSKYILPTPKKPSLKVNVSGWLSCSGKDFKTEPDTTVAAEISIAAEPDIKQELADEDTKIKLEHQEWLAAIKNGIQVRMCNLDISSRLHDVTDAVNLADKTDYSGRKNFKKFVKKQPLHPQQLVMQLKRMQLADGMVTSI
ncbi:nbs [Drosophila busckii]|uniref:Nbs n=1 Tax=Drosophila busckii TaxID=30019 RepID=A0A0M3QWI7_DROBS|nr:nibrin [Drosophila busckii]ALC44219.1 nbs [Drosophila busckii]